MKKTLAALATSLTCALFAACGGGEYVNTNSTSNTSAQTTPTVVGSHPNDNANTARTTDPRRNISNIAFNTPNEMKQDEVRRVELVLSTRQSAEELKRQITGKGAREAAQGLRTTDRVEALLSGVDFEIIAHGPEEVDITLGQEDPSVWSWDVKALKPGTRDLTLVLNNVVYDSPGAAPRRARIQAFSRTITVNVDAPPPTPEPTFTQSTAGFVKDNWQWLWAAIVVPGASFAVALWRRRKGADASAATAAPHPSTSDQQPR